MSKRFVTALVVWLTAVGAAWSVEIIVPETVPTLEQALEGLKEGDRIVLLPGEYTVRPAVPEGIGFSLVGRDGAETTILRGAEETAPILVVSGGGRPVEIRGLTFDRTGLRGTFSLVALEADLTLEGCVFLGGAGLQADSCSGAIRGNRFDGCFDAIRIQNCPFLIEGNEFQRTQQYAVITRGSAARIERNQFRETVSACIVIVGKRHFPVIGGGPGKGNVFVRNLHLLVANESRNDINARYNYWGPVVTSTMERLGYPANIPEFQDKWESDDRAAGEIDYRNWLSSEEEIRGALPVRTLGFLGALLLIALIVIVRRKKSRAA
ncbi:MAG: right-handed parallel beta-helix repeat-containing protein [Candidatus Eisenbacteria bacterium]